MERTVLKIMPNPRAVADAARRVSFQIVQVSNFCGLVDDNRRARSAAKRFR